MTDYAADRSRGDIGVGLGRISYFHNVVPAGPGICRVCRQPATGDVCGRCDDTNSALGGLTCDNTFFLAYADGWNPNGWSQSAKTMRRYKETGAPARIVEDVHVLTNIVTWIHDDCIRGAEGGAHWDAATFVPSRTPRTTLHPVAGIARNVSRLLADDPARGGPMNIARLLMDVGMVDAARSAIADRFAVPDSVRDAIDGRRVLLVDDTWTTGTSLQSAAAALKLAGAASVTGLCVARWLSWDRESQVPLLQRVTLPAYDPFSCIAGDRSCHPPTTQ